MEDFIITVDRREDFDEPKKLYWGEREGDEWEHRIDGDILAELADSYDWGFVGERKHVDGSGKVKAILECLVEREKLVYLTDYTEEELFDEVADGWDNLAEYLFSWDGDLKITGDQLECVYKKIQDYTDDQNRVLETIITELTGRVCEHFVSRGYCQGDVVDCFILEPVEPSEDEMERVKAIITGWMFGRYDTLRLLNEDGDELVRAVVLDYTPKRMIGKSWSEADASTKKAMLDELGWQDKKVGTAEGQKVYSWDWVFTEAE